MRETEKRTLFFQLVDEKGKLLGKIRQITNSTKLKNQRNDMLKRVKAINATLKSLQS